MVPMPAMTQAAMMIDGATTEAASETGLGSEVNSVLNIGLSVVIGSEWVAMGLGRVANRLGSLA